MKWRATLSLALLFSISGCQTSPSANRVGKDELALGDEPDGRSSAMPGSLGETSEAPIPETLWIDDLLRIAAQSSPQIAIARHELGAARGRSLQAALYPNPSLGVEIEEAPTKPLGLKGGLGRVALTQPLVVGSRLRDASQAARFDQERQGFLLDQSRRLVFAQIHEWSVELFYNRRVAELYEQLQRLAEETSELARARLKARAAPEAEFIKADLERRELEFEAQQVSRSWSQLSERLAALLGVSGISLERVLGELREFKDDLDLDKLRTRIEDSHPAVQAAQAQVRAAESGLALAESSIYQDLGLSLAVGRNSAEDSNFFDLGISVPLPIFQRNQGRRLEARQDLQRALSELDYTRRQLAVGLTRAAVLEENARERLRLYRESLVPAAEKVFAQLREGYRVGRSSFLDCLDAQRTLARTRLALLESLRDAHLARINLWTIAGAGLSD